MSIDENRIWNTVELFDLYHENGGSQFCRKTVIRKICQHFGDSMLLLSCTGIASLIAFRRTCALSIVEANDEDNSVATDIMKETLKPDQTCTV